MGIEIFKMAFGILGMIFSVGFLIMVLRKPIKDSKLQILAMGKGSGEVTTSKGIKTNANDEEDTDLIEDDTDILEEDTNLLFDDNTELLSLEEDGELSQNE